MPIKIKDNTKATGRDLFQTPRYATRLLLPFLKPYTMVWEPAAGQGRMVDVLETSQHAVWASDIVVPDGQVYEQFNFLEQGRDSEWMKQIDYIITNPPFSKKKQFYDKCLHYWRLYQIPFCLLIPADYSGWLIKAVRDDGCVKIVPDHRINYITPTGLDEREGHTSNFHSLWLTQGIFKDARDISTPITEVYVTLTKEMREDIV